MDASILLVSLLLLPFLYYRIPSSPRESKYRTALTAFIVIHTLFILRTAIVFAPPNIFTHLEIPLNTPTQVIRAALLQNAYPGKDFKWDDDLPPLPASLEALLKRLGSSELRVSYTLPKRHCMDGNYVPVPACICAVVLVPLTPFHRFGHAVLQNCDYCHSSGEFALYALPIALLSYIREAAVVGVVTIRGTRRERLRVMGLGILLGAAVAEGYWISTTYIALPSSGQAVTMWHDLLWRLRQALFVILPLVLYFLPPSAPSAENPLSTISSTLFKLDNTLKKIHLLKYTRGAVMRTPELRKRAVKWWEEEKREGDWIRSDEAVKRVAEKEGLGFEDGKLRTTVKAAVEILKSGFTPSEFWKPPS